MFRPLLGLLLSMALRVPGPNRKDLKKIWARSLGVGTTLNRGVPICPSLIPIINFWTKLSCNGQPSHAQSKSFHPNHEIGFLGDYQCDMFQFGFLSLSANDVDKILSAKFSVINVVLTRFHRTIIHEFDSSITKCIDPLQKHLFTLCTENPIWLLTAWRLGYSIPYESPFELNA